jgi:NAD(P)H dehydrogenase (quinone)
MADGLIAVTGATGAVGGAVAALLAERGVAQRLVVRDPARAPRLPDTEVRQIADYGHADDVRRALDGVDTLFLVPAQESADRRQRHFAAVDAAAAAGVRKITYLSFVAASETSTFTLGRDHWATEERVRATGLAWTFPRMNLYLDFLPLMVTEAGAIEGPAGDGRTAFVTRDDVAAVCAALLAEGGHDGETHDITGPEAITLAEAAARMSAASGKQIVYHDQTLDEAYASRAVYNAPDWQVEAWVSTYVAIANGDVAEVTNTVRRFTGRPATSLGQFLATLPEALDHIKGGSGRQDVGG